jgi:hypothetical protein
MLTILDREHIIRDLAQINGHLDILERLPLNEDVRGTHGNIRLLIRQGLQGLSEKLAEAPRY